MRQDLFIDIETFSSVDIKECGAYKYIESPDFEILIIGYAFDHEDVRIVDLAQGEPIPDEFIEAMHNPNIRKHAHNAVFERLGFNRIGITVPIDQWYCTAVKAAYCGLPLSLDGVSKALDLKDKKQATGKALIKYFSCPCKPTKVNGGRTRNYPEHAPEKWEMYKEYNKYDVLSEREIYYRLEKYTITDFERKLYIVDQEINDNGILIDMELAKSAIYVDGVCKGILEKKIKDITGVENPNSGAQIKNWIYTRSGVNVDSLDKEATERWIKEFEMAGLPDVVKLLQLRKQLSKTSVKKYYAMVNCAMSDNRVRGTFQFYGANRTGRWAGRLLQLQNLSKNHVDNIEMPRELIRKRDYELVDLLYGDVPDMLSQLVRTALIAPEGKTFAVADFSAIEARVISWLSGEEWRMEVFRGDGKIYEATGARMFGVPIEAITKGSELRAKSKISELALGYEGGVGALNRMGGEKMGLSETEERSIVQRWRKANPKIVEMWGAFEECALYAVRYRTKVDSGYRGVTFDCNDDYLMITLPSGRTLFYREPIIREKPTASGRSRKTLCFKGMDQVKKIWGEVETYGGKLTENIVQAIARDLIGFAMMELRRHEYPIAMHVHDEAIAEVPCDGNEQDYYEGMVSIMKTPPDWAWDLPLNADGYITKFYKKD